MPQVFDSAGSLAISDSVKYFYRLRNDSLWLMPFDSSKLDYFKSISFVEKYLAERYPDILDYVHWDDISCSLYILRRALQTEPEDSPTVSQIYKRIKDSDICGFIMSAPRSIKTKIIAAVTKLMPRKLAFKFLRLVGKLKGDS